MKALESLAVIYTKHGPRPSFYNNYVRSPEWRRRSLDYRRKRGFRCEISGCRNRADCCHHLTYENLGHEPDEDLMALCWQHHEYMHAWPRPHANDNQLTFRFVAANDDLIDVESSNTG